MKRRIAVILGLGILLGLAPATALAGQPIGGCNDGFDLKHANKLTKEVDLNGDGWVCVKDIPAYPPGSINAVDNNAPL